MRHHEVLSLGGGEAGSVGPWDGTGRIQLRKKGRMTKRQNIKNAHDSSILGSSIRRKTVSENGEGGKKKTRRIEKVKQYD